MMCLAAVYLNSVEAENRLMKDVALIEADGDGFWLIDLFGERRFVAGKIQSLNLTNGQCLMLRKPAPD
jgi:predicted RNA-binding protein